MGTTPQKMERAARAGKEKRERERGRKKARREARRAARKDGGGDDDGSDDQGGEGEEWETEPEVLRI
jgi:hypothetical protein